MDRGVDSEEIKRRQEKREVSKGLAGCLHGAQQARSTPRPTPVETHLTAEPLNESYRICILLTIFN